MVYVAQSVSPHFPDRALQFTLSYKTPFRGIRHIFVITTISTLEQSLRACLEAAGIPSAEAQKARISLHTDEKKVPFGDASTNAALILAKQAGNNPRAFAEHIIQTWKHPYIERVELAGPGFINIFLTRACFSDMARGLLTNLNDLFILEGDHAAERYNIEFVSANPTGPLHVGHGRGGIIGDVLVRVLKTLGLDAHSEFYINDAGAQIQRLGTSFKIRVRQALGESVELPEDGYHGTYLSDLAQELLKTHGSEVLSMPDDFFATYAKNHLLERIRHTLENYGISYDVWFSEKGLHENGEVTTALQLLIDRGHAYEQDGALWLRSTTFGDDKDRVLRRASGEPTYVAADVAYMLDKLNRGATRLVYVLGQDHHSYVVRLKAIMAALGHNPDHLQVILYQLVTLKESGELVRMSKRAGTIVSLEDIISEVGTDVARFFYLNRKADAHLDFDLALALQKTDENPVYYLQYAYVRMRSILEKASQHEALRDISPEDIVHLTEAELLLVRKVYSLRDILTGIRSTYQTHTLTYYALECAQLFHRYYAQHRVIDISDIQTTRMRLAFVRLLKNTLASCCNLMGISTPDEM